LFGPAAPAVVPHRLVQVGAGGQGERWCRDFLPPAVDRDLIEVVAAVDVDPDALAEARGALDLEADRCFTDVERAFETVPADCCAVVVPPWAHEEVITAAVEHDLHVLSEKPIADTLAASARIAERVERAGLKMGVTMTHRYDRDKTTLRRRLRSGHTDADGVPDPDPGPLDYLVGRFTCNARSYGAWGEFRHEMADPLLVEGAVHQLDFLADMAGAPCERLTADTWRPEWADYEGDVQALVRMRFENGVRATWEGAKGNAVTLNGWGSDYVRAECRDETLVLDDRQLTRHPYDPDAETVVGSVDEDAGERVALDERPTWGNAWLVERFADWLDGGPPMETDVSSNLRSVTLVEAAVESSERDEPVDVGDLLAEARASVSV
jgi:predicted dehydrogenase